MWRTSGATRSTCPGVVADARYAEHNLTVLACCPVRGYVARATTGRRGLGRCHTQDRPRTASPRDEDPPETRRVSQALSFAEAGGRTRVWTDPNRRGLQAVLVRGLSQVAVSGVGLQCPSRTDTGRSRVMNPSKATAIPPVGARIGHTPQKLLAGQPLLAPYPAENTLSSLIAAVTRTAPRDEPSPVLLS